MALSAQQWRSDLAYLAKELPRRHKNAFHSVSRQDFTAAVAALDARLPGMEGHQVAVEMLRLTALVGDLHTRLQIPAEFHRYPIQVDWFGDELRVTGATAPYRRMLGARVIDIEGVAAEEVQRRVRALIPQAENEWTYLALSPPLIVRPEILHALKIIPAIGATRWRLAPENGAEEVIAVDPVPNMPPPDLVRLGPPLPLYRQRLDENLWFTRLADAETVYVCFRDYEDFASRAKALLAFIDSAPTRRLIIDMRNNGGGDFTKVREDLMPGLRKRKTAFGGGNLFVIIGRRTLSAAMTNAIDLKNDLGATLVGEPTGERPNSYQEGQEMRLPNSGLTLSYSVRYYRFMPTELPALFPDRPVSFGWAAYRSGADSAVDLISSLPR